MCNSNLIYLDTYILQKDMRIRMPKSIIENMNLEKGKSRLRVFYNREDNSLILKPENENIQMDLFDDVKGRKKITNLQNIKKEK